jgi:hypothetical protein
MLDHEIVEPVHGDRPTLATRLSLAYLPASTISVMRRSSDAGAQAG